MKRRKAGVQREISIEEFEPDQLASQLSAEVADWSALPEAAAARGELQQALERAILELPPDFRLVVLLRDVEGLSTRETASALDIGEAAVKMRLHRARLALRAGLAEFYGGAAA